MIDISEMDRETAVLFINGKIYEDYNHQYALEAALADIGTPLNFDPEDDVVLNMTYQGSLESTMCTMDVFNDGEGNKYFASHFEHNIEKFRDLIDEYMRGQNLILSTFVELRSKMIKVI